MKRKLLILFTFFISCSYAQTVALQSFATGFTFPVEIAHPPNDSRLFVVQKGGLIRIVNPDGSINSSPFLTLASSAIYTGGENGLLGLAFHPNYASNGYFYVNYTRNGDGATVIARYTVSSDPNIADTSSATILMVMIRGTPYNHNGGSIKFGPDGYLYIGMGDRVISNISQNLTVDIANPTHVLFGKMLRIDVDSNSPYGIPPTNPYVGQAGIQEIWAIGFRNPWKFSFNRLNGDLWLADVGEITNEEIDKVQNPLPNTGLNFGWPCYEGNTVFDTSSGTCPIYTSTVAPLSQYTHSSGRCSITGGYFYTGTVYPNFANKYFFADYCTGEIGTINTAGIITWRLDASGNITTFGEDKDGELYVAAGNIVYKIIDSSLGVNDFTKTGLSLYPNPADTVIFIKNNSGTTLSKVNVFDLTGKLVLTKAVNNDTTPSVNISALSSGLYLISVEETTGNQYQSKLVVK